MTFHIELWCFPPSSRGQDFSSSFFGLPSKMVFTEQWGGAVIASSTMFVLAMARILYPCQYDDYITKYADMFVQFFFPSVTITFNEHSGERFKQSEAFTAVESYLYQIWADRATRLKAEMGKDSNDLEFSLDGYEEITDEFEGVRVKWHARENQPKQTFPMYPPSDDNGSRYFQLVFHQSDRRIITDSYLKHVMEQGKALQMKKQQRRLYTNSSKYDEAWRKQRWSHVPFEHPATFNTVALDPEKKNAIVQDLLSFSKSRDFYLKIGKPWKRGYLLYGPPGTGKTSMIAAMANLLDYNVYDLELSAVKDNTALRKLLIETTSKSIIVIEDIDCSLALSGERKKEDKEMSEEERLKDKMGTSDKDGSNVTLSGLLNFIDGLWSACGDERLLVFTTNYVEKLDPALVRSGRMDMHIELSYCRFEAFKILAKNYLDIDDHALFEDIKELIEKYDITPADVVEILMPKTLAGIENQQNENCLKKVIQTLQDREDAKEDAKDREDAMKIV